MTETKNFDGKGSFGIKGIFDGQHYFKLEKMSKNQTKFIHGEDYERHPCFGTGEYNWDKMNISFELMNQALKKECEKNK